MAMEISARPFGVSGFGEQVTLWRVESEALRFEVLDYGATLRSLWVRDQAGNWVDVVLGYETLAEYEANDGYLGATVGRVCNRIAGAEFSLNGQTHSLYQNDGKNQLHGGKRGFDKYVWAVETLPDGLCLTRTSPDGEENYPGTMQLCVRYRVEGAALRLEYAAESDQDTLCNLTNHSYFNLNGAGSVMQHEMQLFADRVAERGEGMIPTGRILPVAGGKFDFTTPKTLGRDLPGLDAASLAAEGYDDPLCIPGEGLRKAAILVGDRSGIRMTVSTTQPGMQVYTANFLSRREGKNGAVYQAGDAVCLETQNHPDAIHHENFPSPILRAGQKYQHTTVFAFE